MPTVERGFLLVSVDRAGDTLTLHLTSNGKKVELDDNPQLRRLREILT